MFLNLHMLVGNVFLVQASFLSDRVVSLLLDVIMSESMDSFGSHALADQKKNGKL